MIVLIIVVIILIILATNSFISLLLYLYTQRFDVVFEDTKSGEETVRTHTGRTRRVYGEPAQTESSFLAPGDGATGGSSESEFIGANDARLLTVEDYNRTISVPRRTKDKQSGWYPVMILSVCQ